MAEKVDYAALKKGGFMRQKQKGCFSLRLAVVGGNLTAENIKTVAEVADSLETQTEYISQTLQLSLIHI